MTGWVIAHALGGLGNRMRALMGAVEVAEEDGRRLAYVWPQDSGFQPALTDLWQFDAPRLPRAASLAAHAIARPVREVVPAPEERARHRLLFVKSPHRLKRADLTFYPWEARLRALTPAQPIADEVTGLWSEHLRGRPYVGVSVRAHPTLTHAQTLKESPVSWYLERMAEVRAAAPDVAFFLSCDTAEAEAQIRARFDDVHSIADKGGYNSTCGVQAAVADLYLLAASDWVMAPYWSTFAPLAVALADELPLETSVDRLPVLPELSRQGRVADPLRPWDQRQVRLA